MKKTALALFILFLAYAATGWFLVPRFADKALRDFASEHFELELRFENLLLYPFGFSMHLENLVLLDREGRPLFSASSVDARLGPLSFWTQSARLKSLDFQQPVLHIRDSNEGRGQTVDFLSRLVAWRHSLDDAVQVDILSLKGVEIIGETDSGDSPKQAVPSFDFRTQSLGETRSGAFQLTWVPSVRSPARIEGEMNWNSTGFHGQLHSNVPDVRPPLPGVVPQIDMGNNWSGLAVEAPFIVKVSGQEIVLDVRQAELAAKAAQLGLHPLAGISAEDVSATFDLKLAFGLQGLLLREASGSTGAFSFTGLASASSHWLDVPVSESEIAFSEYRFNANQPVPFSLRLATVPAGEIRLVGQYGTTAETGAMVIELEEVPVSSLFNPNSGILPQAVAGERLSARGRLQVSNSLVSIAMSGGFVSGAELNLSGMTRYTNPMDDSRFELELTPLDATQATSWAESFTGRRILSGTLGAKLVIRAVEGRLAGRYEVSADTLRLERSKRTTGSLEGDPDFIYALLQDSDRHIGFTVPLNGENRNIGMSLSGWLKQETERYLTELDKQPFETLARMLGTEANKLEAVSFQAGQAGLTPRAVEQLEWLKTALQWRPGLALRVSGGYDPDADKYELASQQIRLHVNLAAAVSASQRANSAPIDFSDPRAQSVLDEFAGSRLGRQRVEQISRSFLMAQDSADATLIGTELSGLYRTLFDALVENETITERALLSLARFRARTVIDQLARHGVDRGRLESGELEAVRASVGTGVPTRFKLQLSAPLPEPRVEQSSEHAE